MHEDDLAEARAKIEATREALGRLPEGGDMRRAIARLERLAGELERLRGWWSGELLLVFNQA